MGERQRTITEEIEEQTTAADRISDLPEEIIIKILTAVDLETRTVIQTSVFSRSWRNLWKSVLATNRSFEFPDGRRIAEEEQQRFVALVDGVLSFRDGEYSSHSDDLAVLSVTVNHFPIVTKLLGQIFAHGLAHRARTLRLVALYPISRLPPGLADMWLPVQNLEMSYWDDCRRALEKPWRKFLALKTLRLFRCSLMHSSCRPFSTMTSLTDLEVIECKLSSHPFTISGDKLVRIVLVYSEQLRLHKSKLKLCTPNLKYFTCKGLNPTRFASSELPSLECLDIDVHSRITQWKEEVTKRQASSNCFRMFHSFCRAQRVKLHPNVITELTMFPDILEKEESPFERMQCLEFHNCSSVLPSRGVFNSLISYFFSQAIPEIADFDHLFASDSSEYNSCPVVVCKNDLIA